MNKTFSRLTVLAGLLLFLLSFPESSRSEFERVLPAAISQVEIFSLEPFPRWDLLKKHFHGVAVLGMTRVRSAEEISALIAAFQRDVAEGRSVAHCFHPRHGLRIVSSQGTIDVVICFECSAAHIIRGETETTVAIDRTSGPLFDEMLRRAGVKLSQKAAP